MTNSCFFGNCAVLTELWAVQPSSISKENAKGKKCIGQQMLFFLYCCTFILGTVFTFNCQMQNLFSVIRFIHWRKCSREAFMDATIIYKYMRNAGFAFAFCHFGFYYTVKSMWNQKLLRLNCCKKLQHCTVMYMLQWQATMFICKYPKLHSSTPASVLQTFFIIGMCASAISQ